MTKTPRHGTQSIERTVSVLRELALHSRLGWSLADLAAQCGLGKPTTHRILACLVRERMAAQRREDGHYLLGPLAFELGLAIHPLNALVDSGRTAVARLSRRFNAICMLSLRSGSDCVHVARHGTVPIRGLGNEVGDRKPLIMVSGGLAIMATLPGAEVKEIIAVNMAQLARLGYAGFRYPEEMVQRARKNGYGFNRSNVLRGVHGLGVAICNSQGVAFAALSVTGAANFFAPLGVEDVVAALKAEAQAIQRDRQLLSSLENYYAARNGGATRSG